MQLKLLIATLAVLSSTSACTVHFPLADNSPSLSSSDDSPSASSMRLAPTEPDSRNPVKGNAPDTPN